MLEENIRIMRREKGLTQEQLAEVMGVSTASVSKWETGMAVPELSMIAALADYFEMSIDALIGHTVDKSQLEGKVAAVKELSHSGEDDKALVQIEELLRRYPNEYCVVECAASVYYTAFIHKAEREKMLRCMELVRRKYDLSKESSGKKWFELRTELANCHELLKEWDLAKEFYEKSNVAGMNDSEIARCLAEMGEVSLSISGISKSVEGKLFTIIRDLMYLAELWEQQGKRIKAKATYYGAIHLMDACKLQTDLKMMKLICRFALASFEQEDGNFESANELIRQAVRIEASRDLVEIDSEDGFLQSENVSKIIHTEFDGNSQIVLWLMAKNDEELLAVAKDELTKLQTAY